MMNLTTKVIDDCENSPTVLKKVIVLEISNLPSIPDNIKILIESIPDPIKIKKYYWQLMRGN